jgi:hypothetical protein
MNFILRQMQFFEKGKPIMNLLPDLHLQSVNFYAAFGRKFETSLQHKRLILQPPQLVLHPPQREQQRDQHRQGEAVAVVHGTELK